MNHRVLDALDRRAFLKVGGTGAAATVAALTLGRGAADAGTPSDLAPAGWNLYTYEVLKPHFPEIIRTHKPGVVRWFLEWDAVHIKRPGDPAIPPPPSWEEFLPFFDALRDAGSRLVVQFHVVGALWQGWGQAYANIPPGTQWAKRDAFSNYPMDVDASFGSFARSLRDTLAAHGVVASYGAFNEPDHRYVLDGFISSKVNNVSEGPWRTSMTDSAKWSGGKGEVWRAMHDVMPDESWNSSMVWETDWAAATAAIPQVELVTISRYFGADRRTNQTLDYLKAKLSQWDAITERRLPIFIAESATSDQGSHLTVAEAAKLWQRHRLLTDASSRQGNYFFNRYQGMTAHVGLPWDDPESPLWAWWEYKPEYDQYLQPEDALAPAEPGTNLPTTPPAGLPQPQVPGGQWTPPEWWRELERWFQAFLRLLGV